MAYDSATPTALALRAYERANLTQQARRARLKQGYGLNEDGTLASSGSLYQGNLDSVNAMEGAESSDRARGFVGSGGLAGKRSARANQAGLLRQSSMFNDAFGNIAETTQAEADNKGQYEDTLTQIRANSDRDVSETLAANLVRQRAAEAAEAERQRSAAIPASAPQPTVYDNPLSNLFSGPSTPAKVAAQIAALKKNPRAAQTAKNNRY